MAAGTPTIVYASTDTFIVDVAWLAADVTDTVIAHGLGDTPEEVTQSLRVVNAAHVYPMISYLIDETNLTARKFQGVGAADCTVRYVCRRISHV